jgi:hypothetical protein
MRLNDEKRSLIIVNDVIEFTNTTTNETMSCLELKWFIFANQNKDILYVSSHAKCFLFFVSSEVVFSENANIRN